jgi:hypothetical protein
MDLDVISKGKKGIKNDFFFFGLIKCTVASYQGAEV